MSIHLGWVGSQGHLRKTLEAILLLARGDPQSGSPELGLPWVRMKTVNV